MSNEKIDPFDFIKRLEEEGYDYFTGVPCSYLKELIYALDYLGKWIPAVNEGTAVGMAFGAYLAGKKPCVLLSLSGLPNALNPILTLVMPYYTPIMIVIGGRGGPDDAPQHQYLWKFQDAIQEMFYHYCNIRMITFEKGYFKTTKPYFSIEDPLLLSRSEVIKIIMRWIKDDEIVITNLGLTSRLVSSEHHRRGNFYMTGSMGHALSIAQGLAPFTDKRIIVIDGDGSILSNPSPFYNLPKNVLHIILKNNTYGSTGGQRLPIPDVDYKNHAGRSLTIRCRDDTGTPPRVQEGLVSIAQRIKRFIKPR